MNAGRRFNVLRMSAGKSKHHEEAPGEMQGNCLHESFYGDSDNYSVGRAQNRG